MKITTTYKFEAHIIAINILNTFCCEIAFTTCSDAKQFHKLICSSNTFRNCFSHIDENKVVFEFNIDTTIKKDTNGFTISITQD